MGFHFQCPQGHLLQGEPAMVGQESACPICGTVFVVPAPMGAVVMPQPPLPFGNVAVPFPGPEIQIIAQDSAGRVELPESPSEQLFHIPCPNGHELEVPTEMLDQDALCPTCQVQFRLRAKDSLEHKRRQHEAFERRQHKLGQTWLTWSVAIALIVVVGLMVLIALQANR